MRMRLIFLLMLMFASCASNELDAEVEDQIKPFNVSLDMSEDEVRALYSDCEFIPVDPGDYGLCDGGNPTFDVVRNNTVLFFFWNHHEGEKLGGFILLDPKQSWNNAYVGMTVGDLLKLFPEAQGTISLLDSSESIFTAQENNCWFRLNTTEGDYAADYTFDEGEYQFVQFDDLEKQIESIFIKRD